MSKRNQSCIAGFLALVGVLALAGVVYLSFVFPKTIEMWLDQGRRLSATEQTLADLSHLCTSFGLILIPCLLLGTIGFGVWAVMAGMGGKQETANN